MHLLVAERLRPYIPPIGYISGAAFTIWQAKPSIWVENATYRLNTEIHGAVMNTNLLATFCITLLSLPVLSSPAVAETTIAVSCQCKFMNDSAQQTILVYAERTQATEFDIENCTLVDGKVAPGTCWSAKGPAHMTCIKEIKQTVPKQFIQMAVKTVAINEDACYGQIDKQ